MIAGRRADLAKEMIEEGKAKTFGDIFIYVTKTYVADKMGMNYKRLVRLTLNLEKMKYGETNFLAKVLNVDPKLISDLIHNELALLKKSKKTKPRS